MRDADRIIIGYDSEGVEHHIFADRNLHHKPSMMCGCNPDADSDREGVEWWVSHRPFDDEVKRAADQEDTDA